MFLFTEDCILGIEEIDNEHRHLFEMINQVLDMLNKSSLLDQYQEIKDLIADLENYADQHFDHEEAYMKKIRDPELILQRSQHMVFREKIDEFDVVSVDLEEEQVQVLRELLEFLAKWLYHHILGSDIMIGKLPPLEEWMIRDNPCEFTDEYLNGIPLVDAEHKALFAIVEKANNLVRSQDMDSTEKIDKILEILQSLKGYAKDHFHDEEEYMASISYNGLEAQKRAHDAFIDKIENISMKELYEHPQEYLHSLLQFLLGWLINHILHTDKKIPVPELEY